MINKKKKPLYLFMHIPRTGGNSLSKYIQYGFGENRILYLTFRAPKNDFTINDTFNNDYLIEPYSMEIEKNGNYDAVFGHFRFGLHEKFPNRDCKYITFLRNPINQVISSYFFIKKELNYIVKDLNSISDIITNSKFPTNMQAFFISGLDFNSMNDDPNLTLKTAINNLQKYFIFIGRTEEYNKSINNLFNLLKWKNNYCFHENQGNYNSLEISQQVIETIKEIYILDIELYKSSTFNI